MYFNNMITIETIFLGAALDSIQKHSMSNIFHRLTYRLS